MKIVVLCGGVSTERDVSIVSGTKIYEALKSRGHQVVLLDIFLGYEGETAGLFDKDIDWARSAAKVHEEAPDLAAVKASRKDQSDRLFGPGVIELCTAADIVFMGLHGDSGENGKVQAAFDLFGIRYTGTDPFSSALAMDKWVAKQLFKSYGVNTPEACLLNSAVDAYRPKEYPVVVKVCNGGSSIGVYIVRNEADYLKAVAEAFTYEGRVIVEQFIEGIELTDCVIDGQALPIVQIVPKTGFYDYKNKYQAGSTLEYCPAPISEDLTKRVQEMAVQAYKALGIRTYARMDFLVNSKDEIFCLEANTLPGMTPTSLIPQEAAAVGKSFPDLCEWIIEISMAKYK